MSEEKIAAEQLLMWCNQGFWMVVSMFVAGSVGRTLVSGEAFDGKKLAGEIILSSLAAITLLSFNVMQGMSLPQIIFFGALGSMGGVRTIDWVIRFAKQAKNTGDS